MKAASLRSLFGPIALGSLSITIAGMTHAAPIDLSSWEQRGNPASGNWVVSGDGFSVTQTINGGPTFFVSPETSLGKSFNGKFRVSDPDDDFVGFVFGFNEPDGDSTQFDFLLFDWKKASQPESVTGTVAEEGFTLSRVDGVVADIPPDSTGTEGYWSHTHPAMTVLATDLGSGKGWESGIEYEFTLLYELDRIKIGIDGVTIFDFTGGPNPDGRFGFYNFSQANVLYEGFTRAEIPEPGPLVLVFLGLAGLGFAKRTAQASPIVKSGQEK